MPCRLSTISYLTCAHEIIVNYHAFQVKVVAALQGFEVQHKTDIEDITRWREDMNFMFEWQEQYLMSE